MSIICLPKGYYAVQSDYENADKNSFTYKGVTYSVTEGENLFQTLAEAQAAASDVPEQKIEGISELYNVPVILFSEGKHSIDKFIFDRSLILLGQGADVTPNFKNEVGDVPTLDPKREKNESVLIGSFWHGKMTVSSPDVRTVVYNGFTIEGARFNDTRREGEELRLEFRNLSYPGYSGHQVFAFASPKAEASLSRSVEFIGIRVAELDDCDFGASFIGGYADHIHFKDVCYADTAKTFGCLTAPEGRSMSYKMEDSFFKNTECYGGFTLVNGAGAIEVDLKNSSFINLSYENEPGLRAGLGEKSSLRAENCMFADTRENSRCAIEINGATSKVILDNCVISGFAGEIEECIIRTEAPDRIADSEENYVTESADPHTVVGSKDRDMSALDDMYEGRKVYRGDLHVHTNCGGTSDGTLPMSEWPAQMDALEIDFAAVVDHRQMRGFFLPEWDDLRFLIGTEPGATIENFNASRHGMRGIHYNMLFPHKYGLAMVLANFPEFKFSGDELTGSFKYFAATKERYMELFEYVRSIGGMVVHPHPKQLLVSNDPMDYYIGEHTYLETIYGSVYGHATRKNYQLWQDILALGKHVYASGGSDSHSVAMNTALSSFYTKERAIPAFYERMRAGDFNVGSVGIKMCIDEHPMGSEIEYRDGMKLSVRIEDFFHHEWRANTVYALRVFTDKGLAYCSEFNGKDSQELQLEVQKRNFYRVDVYDITHDCVVAVGNPIWMDKEAGTRLQANN